MPAGPGDDVDDTGDGVERGLRALGARFGVAPDPFYAALYGGFPGWAAPDGRMVTLWPVARILAEADLAEVFDGRLHVAVGDVMVDSDFLMACLEDASAPVRMLYAIDTVAGSAGDYLSRAIRAGGRPAP